MVSLLFFFFFSSRRRHTRLQGDWSSDVCSSDLERRRVERRHARPDPRDSAAARSERLRAHQPRSAGVPVPQRSEEHTSELQSPCNLVCRLLLEKKKTESPV